MSNVARKNCGVAWVDKKSKGAVKNVFQESFFTAPFVCFRKGYLCCWSAPGPSLAMATLLSAKVRM